MHLLQRQFESVFKPLSLYSTYLIIQYHHALLQFTTNRLLPNCVRNDLVDYSCMAVLQCYSATWLQILE